MNQAERWGVELVMLAKRQQVQQQELDETTEKIAALWKAIQDSDSEIYTNTSEIPAVSERLEQRHNLGPMPVRLDRPDGGNTYRLNPIGDAVTEKLPAPVDCPNVYQDGACTERGMHAHFADGSVRAVGGQWVN